MQDLTQKTLEFFSHDHYALDSTGVEIVKAGDKEAVCRLKIEDKHLNAAGIVMGGALFTLADMAFTVAANAQILADGRKENIWLTLDSQIHFLKAVGKGTLTATARCIKSGRTTCLYTVEVRDEQETLISTIQSTGIRSI